MYRNVARELLHQVSVNHLRIVVRYALVKTFVERQQMACRARICKFYRRHQLSVAPLLFGWQSTRAARLKFLRRRVSNRSQRVILVAELPMRIRRSRSTVAVAAI